VLMAAAQMPEIAAVLAQSTYTSIEDNIAAAVRELTGLPPFPFAPLVIFFGQREAGVDLRVARPVDTIGQISPRPLLIIHGQEDGLFNVENAYHLYEAAGEPKEIQWWDAGHRLPDTAVLRAAAWLDHQLRRLRPGVEI